MSATGARTDRHRGFLGPGLAVLVVVAGGVALWIAGRRDGSPPARAPHIAPSVAPSAAAVLAGGTLHGRVVDLPTAHGVPGARVTVSGELEIESMAAPPDRLSTTSGPNGEFELHGLRPGVIRLAAAA